jgi:uncharacterized protein
MPAPLRAWYSLRDIESLAARKAVLSGAIKLDELSRLAEMVTPDSGSVDVRLSFDLSGNVWQTLQLQYATELTFVCQRCLEPMSFRIKGDVAFCILPAAALEAAVPAGIESIVLNEERLCPLQLIEDELILSLPLVPKHADRERCMDIVEQNDGLKSAGTDNTANA